MGPFDRFNDRAKRVFALAQDEAIRFNHDHLGPEHLLLGLIREGEGMAAGVLRSLGIDLGAARRNVEETVHRREGDRPGEITLTPQTKRVVERAITEARALGSDHVGTEHLLLGLLGVAAEDASSAVAKAIASLGLGAESIRRALDMILGTQASRAPTSGPHSWTSSVHRVPGQPEDLSAFHSQQLSDVRRVIAVGEPRALGDATLTLLSFEIYSDGAVAQFLVAQRRAPESPPGALVVPRFKPTLRDDKGTDYASRSHGGSGGAGGPTGVAQWRMAQAFAPAIPADARTVTLSAESLTWFGPGSDPTEMVETLATSGHAEWTVQLG